jgi:membrane-associated phospholipid phosphatase
LSAAAQRNPKLARALARYSLIGENAAVWLAIGTAGLAISRSPGRREAWADGLDATLCAFALNVAIKHVVRRPRPPAAGAAPLTPLLTQMSFPSTHATTSFAAAGVFARALPPATPLFYALAGTLAVSRPALGVHYPSDVLAGAALGSAIAKLWPR